MRSGRIGNCTVSHRREVTGTPGQALPAPRKHPAAGGTAWPPGPNAASSARTRAIFHAGFRGIRNGSDRLRRRGGGIEAQRHPQRGSDSACADAADSSSASPSLSALGMIFKGWSPSVNPTLCTTQRSKHLLRAAEGAAVRAGGTKTPSLRSVRMPREGGYRRPGPSRSTLYTLCSVATPPRFS